MITQNKITRLALKAVYTLALAAIFVGSAYGQAQHGTYSEGDRAFP